MNCGIGLWRILPAGLIRLLLLGLLRLLSTKAKGILYPTALAAQRAEWRRRRSPAKRITSGRSAERPLLLRILEWVVRSLPSRLLTERVRLLLLRVL